MRFAFGTSFCDPTHLCAMARAAEEAGWDAICVPDHVAIPQTMRASYPDGESAFPLEAAWPEPWSMIASMAAVTERLEFFTCIYILPLRDPFLTAKAVSTVAALSAGRVALGVGVGWMEDEFDLLKQSFRGRGRRSDEIIEVLRKLWTGEMVEHHGELYDFDPLVMLPKPPKPVPIWIGGGAEPVLRRAARIGDGWIASGQPLAELEEVIDKLHRYRAEYGRADRPFEVLAGGYTDIGLDGYRRMEEMGVSCALWEPWGHQLGGPAASLEGKLDTIKRFADETIHKLG
jgi:probable F420-dependent oxidoreductase